MFTISITDLQQFTLTVGTVTDAKGNVVPTPPGSMSWSVDNPALLSITPSSDGLSCLVAAMGPLGVGNVTVSLMDSTGRPLATGQGEVTVVASAPTSITLTGSTPVAIP